MLAVIATGGKQYSVSEGDIVSVEKMDGEVGASVTFDEVLMFKDGDVIEFGTPTLDNRQVTGEIIAQKRGKKTNITKFRRRKRYLRYAGHRQHVTQVKITDLK